MIPKGPHRRKFLAGLAHGLPPLTDRAARAARHARPEAAPPPADDTPVVRHQSVTTYFYDDTGCLVAVEQGSGGVPPVGGPAGPRRPWSVAEVFEGGAWRPLGGGLRPLRARLRVTYYFPPGPVTYSAHDAKDDSQPPDEQAGGD